MTAEFDVVLQVGKGDQRIVVGTHHTTQDRGVVHPIEKREDAAAAVDEGG
jgi:hypothetical protein